MFPIIDKKPEIRNRTSALYQRIFDPSVPKYLMGRNPSCETVRSVLEAKGLRLDGMIDDYTDQQEDRGLPVLRAQEADRDGLVISCVIEGRLITALDRLRGLGFEQVLTYLDLHLHDPSLFPHPPFCENNAADIEANPDQYQWLHQLLADQLSRDTLAALTDFRYNFNADAMRVFPFRLGDQYFDMVASGQANAVFVDCGAFDGETTKQFIQLNPEYARVHVFEPSPSACAKTTAALSAYPRVDVHPYATYKEPTTLRFDSEQGGASGFSASGNVEVKAVALDDLIEEATLIKMDVEGAEYDTLLGAERLITAHKPQIAVCVYHNQPDFWRIPRLLLQFNPNYKVYLRHYTEGLYETVMYFF